MLFYLGLGAWVNGGTGRGLAADWRNEPGSSRRLRREAQMGKKAGRENADA